MRWHYRLQAAGRRRQRYRREARSAPRPPSNCRKPAGRCARAPTPRLRSSSNIERFTQYLTLVGLTALLVGGVGVANAVKDHLDRRRDAIATLKSLGATGARVFAIYLTQVMVLALLGAIPGLIVGAALPFLIAWGFGSVLPLPLAPALHPARAGARGALRLPHRGRLRAVAARTRARRPGLGPVSRGGRAAIGAGRARAYVVATVLVAAALTVLAVEARLRQAHRGDLRGRRGGRVRAAAARCRAGHVDRAARAAPALAGRAAGDRQHPSAGRADAERGAVARPGPRAARHRDRDRRQPAPAVHRRAAREGAVVLLRRYPGRRGGEIRCLHPRRTRRAPCSTGCRCCAGASWRRNGVAAEQLKPPPDAAWALQSDRGITYRRRHPGGLARRRGRMVEARLSGAAAGLVRETHRRWPRAEGRRHRHGQRARPQYRQPPSPTCAPSTGRASASISSWCSRPTASAARR